MCTLTSDKLEEKLEFVRRWVLTHIEDGDKRPKKPVMLSCSQNSDCQARTRTSTLHSETGLTNLYTTSCTSLPKGIRLVGSFIWQIAVKEMHEYNDDFGMVPWKKQSTFEVIARQSCRLARLRGGYSHLPGSFRDSCQQTRL